MFRILLLHASLLAFLFLWPPASDASDIDYVFGDDLLVTDHPPGTYGHKTESSGQHSIAVFGDTVHLVWMDSRAGTSNVYSAKSADGGLSFEPSVRVNDASYAIRPCLAADEQGTLHVAWVDGRASDYNYDIYYDRSLDGGESFGTDLRVSGGEPAELRDFQPTVAVDDESGAIHLVWTHKTIIHDMELHLVSSADGGASFSPPRRIDDGGLWSSIGSPSLPSLAIGRVTGRGEAMVLGWHGCDHGCWPRVTVYPDPSQSGWHSRWMRGPYRGGLNTSVAISPSGAIVTAYESVESFFTGERNETLRVSVSEDGGQTFQEHTLTPGPSLASLAVGNDGAIYVAWNRPSRGPQDVWFTCSSDGGETFSAPVRVNDVEGTAVYPTLTVGDDDRVYIAWTDTRWWGSGDVYFDVGVPAEPSAKEIDIPGVAEGQTANGADVLNDNTPAIVSPNPVRSIATVRLALSEIDWVGDRALIIYDARGRAVRELMLGSPGSHIDCIEWDTCDERGDPVPSGVYFACLISGVHRQASRLVIIR